MLWRLPEIHLAPDIVFKIGAFPVTNTLICTWITIVILVGMGIAATWRRDLIPRGVQNLGEWAVELLTGLVEGVASKSKAKKFFPLVASFFLFILFANLLDVIPGVDTIGTITDPHVAAKAVGGFLLFDYQASNQIIPWIRPATSDLNLTLAMALISVIVTQIFGFYWIGARAHLSKYFNFKGPIDFFVGIVEIVSEVARIISFSFRLFGNIFAGSIVLAVFAFVLPVVADVAFIPLELFVAFMQALIFGMLTLVFLEVATSSHEGHTETEEEGHRELESGKAKKAAATH